MFNPSEVVEACHAIKVMNKGDHVSDQQLKKVKALLEGLICVSKELNFYPIEFWSRHQFSKVCDIIELRKAVK